MKYTWQLVVNLLLPWLPCLAQPKIEHCGTLATIFTKVNATEKGQPCLHADAPSGVYLPMCPHREQVRCSRNECSGAVRSGARIAKQRGCECASKVESLCSLSQGLCRSQANGATIKEG